MKPIPVLPNILYAGALVLSLGFALPLLAADPATSDTSDPRVERGKYLVDISGCHDCHTPWREGPEGPEPDLSRMLSGHPQSLQLPPPPKTEAPWIATWAATNTAISGPWGVSYTANLTPDPEAGLGKWTAQTFKDTIRNGRRMGRGRPLLPPMPWPVYRNMTDEDLEAVFAYLQSIPAIANRVPEPVPPAEGVD